MGNSESSSTDPPDSFLRPELSRNMDWKSLERYLGPSLLHLRAMVNSSTPLLSRIPDPLGDRMFDLITRNRHDQKLTFEDLVIAKATYEKGTKDEIEEFIFQLLDINGNGEVSRSDVQAVLAAILADLFPSKDHKPGSSSHPRLLDAIVSAPTFPTDGGRNDKSMSLRTSRTCVTMKYLGSLLTPPDSGRPGSQVPHLMYSEGFDSKIILTEEYAWLIGGLLTQAELEEWKLLYHSSYHGLSFSTFLGNISILSGTDLVEALGLVAQRIRVRDYEPRCRGFDSILAHSRPRRE
ncbi:hypothetical protein Cgig2_021700 [Carnegiea gigantea]|uniref:EF-hand domain-containing protein n=1 Tax=Carnegiea gigantea TaxID=171969 RepID=A0A9Q1QPR4_9CARY|nr:hypothetical protein Cgig2_021700 [Carnegiea gigantea]